MDSPTHTTTNAKLVLASTPLARFDFEDFRGDVFVSASQPVQYYYTPVPRLKTAEDGKIDVHMVELVPGFHRLRMLIDLDPSETRQMALSALQSVVPGATIVRPLPLVGLGWRIVDPIPLDLLGITVYRSTVHSGAHAPLEILVAGTAAHARQIENAMQRFCISARLTFAAWSIDSTTSPTHTVDVKTGQLGISRAWIDLWVALDAHQRRATVGQVLRLAEQFRRDIASRPNQRITEGRAASNFERLTAKCIDNLSTRVIVWDDTERRCSGPVLLQKIDVSKTEIEAVLNNLFRKIDDGRRQFHAPQSGSTEEKHWALWGCGWPIGDGQRCATDEVLRQLRERCGLWVVVDEASRLAPTKLEAVTISYKNIMPGARQVTIARLHTGAPLRDGQRIQRELQLSSGYKRKQAPSKKDGAREAKKRNVE